MATSIFIGLAVGGVRSISVSTDGLSRLIVGGATWSRMARQVKAASIAPAAPSRWPVADLVELIVTLAAALLHEALAPIQVVGGVAILTAALLLQRAAPSGSAERIEPAAVPSVEHG